jgi:hypothetical protein
MKKLLILILLGFLFIMCDRNDKDKIPQNEGYIVGFDPCSYQHNYKLGYAIITTNLKDTLMTYNLPDSIFIFPPEYFYNYFNSGYFPSKARYEFKIKFTYTIANKDQQVYNLCTTDINAADFINSVQVIMTSVTKY